ncbi:MAG: imidazole glycerol phosphate synthase, glutamine amidotransferase subunit, partial [Deltaproteobacteria bacterium RIFOXYB2_FULL_66_7]
MTRGSAIGVVDYGMGNLRSVSKALESLGFPTLVSGDPGALSSCRGIVFPGVGAFRDCMGNVVRQGLLPFLREYLVSDRPFLGICVGMQLLFSGSEEFGRHEGIGFFPGNVVRFPGDMPARDGSVLKVPHMGWNEVEVVGDPPALHGIPSGTYFYFVHSYYAAPEDPGDVVCRSTYGVPFAAAVGRGNRLAVQFHP